MDGKPCLLQLSCCQRHGKNQESKKENAVQTQQQDPVVDVDSISSAGKGTSQRSPTAIHGDQAPYDTSHHGQDCSHGATSHSNSGARDSLLAFV